MEKQVKTPASKRRANDKWDKENMCTLACKVRREDAEDFKAYARQHGKTVNTILQEFVFARIREMYEDNEKQGDA